MNNKNWKDNRINESLVELVLALRGSDSLENIDIDENTLLALSERQLSPSRRDEVMLALLDDEKLYQKWIHLTEMMALSEASEQEFVTANTKKLGGLRSSFQTKWSSVYIGAFASIAFVITVFLIPSAREPSIQQFLIAHHDVLKYSLASDSQTIVRAFPEDSPDAEPSAEQRNYILGMQDTIFEISQDNDRLKDWLRSKQIPYIEDDGNSESNHLFALGKLVAALDVLCSSEQLNEDTLNEGRLILETQAHQYDDDSGFTDFQNTSESRVEFCRDLQRMFSPNFTKSTTSTKR